ncbi:MAG: hypothetical protein U0P46_06110 [Holophagaceae bacterium]
MGIVYRVDSKAEIVFTTWTGQITSTVLGDFYRSVLNDKAALRFRRSVTNIQDADLLFTGEEFSHLVHTIVEPVLKGLGWITTIVVKEGDKVQWGVSRQYQAFAQRFSESVIFTDEASAITYLQNKGGAPSAIPSTPPPAT